MPRLYEEEFQVLLDVTLSRERKFNQAAGYMISPGGANVGAGLSNMQAQGRGGSGPTPISPKMRFLGLDMTLRCSCYGPAPPGSTVPWAHKL